MGALTPLPYDTAFWGAVLLTVVMHTVASVPTRGPRRAWRRLRRLEPEDDGGGSGGGGAKCDEDGQSPPAVLEPSTSDGETRAFTAFQHNYLVVYLLAVAADWLQGPYVYALYTHYGYEKGKVGQLYIAGFASSAVFGTFVASVADKYGRKNSALLYCLTYMLSCATKHSGNFWVLLLGRLLGGIAYSILFSAFESWMVYEHGARRFSPSLLAATFAKAQLCNGIVAIFSGKIAGWFATRYGKVTPFDLAIVVLAVLFALISFTWSENYGDKTASVQGGFSAAWAALCADRKILLLCLIQSSFEGAMYTFTFIWTPALQAPHDKATVAMAEAARSAGAAVPSTTLVAELPFGTIFSSFMCATMIGSSLFAILSRHARVEAILRGVFALGVLLFSATIISTRVEVTYAAFVLFEVLCGVYFPAMGTMRAPYMPEENRSALLTFSRVPLNMIVVLTLYEDFSLRRVFMLCAALMAAALLCQHRLLGLSRAVAAGRDGVESGKVHRNLPLLAASSAEVERRADVSPAGTGASAVQCSARGDDPCNIW
jgi:MFS transporter, MFS domain-containing protein family, molybdate-anion transporter